MRALSSSVTDRSKQSIPAVMVGSRWVAQISGLNGRLMSVSGQPWVVVGCPRPSVGAHGRLRFATCSPHYRTHPALLIKSGGNYASSSLLRGFDILVMRVFEGIPHSGRPTRNQECKGTSIHLTQLGWATGLRAPSMDCPSQRNPTQPNRPWIRTSQ